VLEHDAEDWEVDAAGRPARSHQGPSFVGPFLVGAEQTLDGMSAPTVILADLNGKVLDADGMGDLAEQVVAASQWLAHNS
jgi:hypothetical protein